MRWKGFVRATPTLLRLVVLCGALSLFQSSFPSSASAAETSGIRLKIEGNPPGGSFTITVDDQVVPPSALGAVRELKPGTHTIVVKSSKKQVVFEVLVEASKVSEVVIDLKTDQEGPMPATTPAGAAPVTPPASATTDGSNGAPKAATSAGSNSLTNDSGERPKSVPLGTIGLAAGGVGLVVVGVGGVLALSAKSAYSDAKDAHCATGTCDAEGKRLTDDARGRADVASIVVGVGAVLAVGGAVLWLVAPSATKNTGVTSVGLGPGTFSVGGYF